PRSQPLAAGAHPARPGPRAGPLGRWGARLVSPCTGAPASLTGPLVGAACHTGCQDNPVACRDVLARGEDMHTATTNRETRPPTALLAALALLAATLVPAVVAPSAAATSDAKVTITSVKTSQVARSKTRTKVK